MRQKELETVRKPHAVKFDRVMHFKLYDEFPTTKNGQIGRLELLVSPKLLPRIYVCDKSEKCRYETHNLVRFERHQKICGITNVQKIDSRQTVYGAEKSPLQKIADLGYIPAEAANYENYTLATFDIETIEEKFTTCAPERGMVTVAGLKLLSIAIGSNIPNYTPKCWVRNSMEPSEETRIITKFVDELVIIQGLKIETLPNWIMEGIETLEEEINRFKALKKKWWEYAHLTGFQKTLISLCRLDIFGFNSAKFDIPVIYAPLMLELKKRYSKVSVLKKNTSYMSISTTGLVFKDALKYTSPCSYSKYLKVWGVQESKSLWPYSLYGTIAEMKEAKKFPTRSQFASALRGDVLPEMGEYIAAKREFARRRLLPKTNPERVRNMKDWLKVYNLLDVQPLALAIEASFRAYRQYFNVDSMLSLSLPSLAQKAMFLDFFFCRSNIFLYFLSH